MRLDVHQVFSLASLPLEPPFHRGPYQRAPSVQGDPGPRLHLHCLLRFLATGETLHPGLHLGCSNVRLTLGLHPNPYLGRSRVSANSLQQRKIAQNLVNLNETQVQLSRRFVALG